MYFYLWIKSLHLIALICWYAGLFYLPRLYVYHSVVEDEISHQRFSLMSFRLYYYIMNPSMVLTIGSGLGMTYLNPSLWQQGWFHIKLTAVLLLVVFHVLCGVYQHRLAKNMDVHSQRFYRFFNEIPTLILLLVVPLVVLQPHF